MNILELRNINKIYQTGNEKKYALKNINISFPSTGLVSIFGKSGCGKTTFLNICALIDKPSSGEVLFYEQNMCKWKNKEVNEYHGEQIGIVFQHYYLIENKTPVFNIMLPMIISGYKEADAKNDAEALLESIKFPKNLNYEKVSNLSGGEKERIALLRGIICNPKIVFADEPTGALDQKNAIVVMEALKKLSKKKLILLVSHNRKLVEEYSDRIIEMQDGKIVKDTVLNNVNNFIPLVKTKRKKKEKKWIGQVARLNLRSRFGFHVFSGLAFIFSICATSLMIGFSNNAKNSIHEQLKNHFDYGTATVTKEIKKTSSSNGLSIVQTVRPDLEEIYSSNQGIKENFFICTNYDALLNNYKIHNENNRVIEHIGISSIYSFASQFTNSDMIVEGTLPNEDTLNNVVVNEECARILSKFNITINDKVSIDSSFEYYKENRLIQRFEMSETFTIKCIVKELKFLSSPKLYYSHLALDEYMTNCFCEGKTWKETIENENNTSDLASYSYKLFLKTNEIDISKIQTEGALSITSNALIVNNALEEFCDTGMLGMYIYLAITILGTSLIIGITSFFNYSRDRKKIALFSCLGSSFNDIVDIYLTEGLYIAIFSIFCGLILTIGLEYLTNTIIESTTGLKSFVKIPWNNFLNIPAGFAVIMSLGFLLILFISTVIPLLISKRVSIKEELKEK